MVSQREKLEVIEFTLFETMKLFTCICVSQVPKDILSQICLSLIYDGVLAIRIGTPLSHFFLKCTRLGRNGEVKEKTS